MKIKSFEVFDESKVITIGGKVYFAERKLLTENFAIYEVDDDFPRNFIKLIFGVDSEVLKGDDPIKVHVDPDLDIYSSLPSLKKQTMEYPFPIEEFKKSGVKRKKLKTLCLEIAAIIDTHADYNKEKYKQLSEKLDELYDLLWEVQ